jgi:hypothetical protein
MRSDIAPGGTFPDYELPDHEDVARRLSELSVGAQWPFLSDPGRIVQKDLEIQEYTDPENDPMIPHTLVLKPGLVIHRSYNGYWFWGRPSVIDLWHDLRDVGREIWPDWDLSAPGLREAWDAGDLSRFHGWNKRTAARGGVA